MKEHPTQNLYEVCAKGDRIPEKHPNSTSLTWKAVQPLIWATTGAMAIRLFERDYAGEYTEIISVKAVPVDSELYKLAAEARRAS